MNGCVYRTADNQCQKYSDPIRNTMSWCVGNEPCEGRTPSNADLIRQMTDEDLAHFMARVCPPGAKCNEDGNCFSCRRDWLKSPVEEGEG